MGESRVRSPALLGEFLELGEWCGEGKGMRLLAGLPPAPVVPLSVPEEQICFFLAEEPCRLVFFALYKAYINSALLLRVAPGASAVLAKLNFC